MWFRLAALVALVVTPSHASAPSADAVATRNPGEILENLKIRLVGRRMRLNDADDVVTSVAVQNCQVGVNGARSQWDFARAAPFEVYRWFIYSKPAGVYYVNIVFDTSSASAAAAQEIAAYVTACRAASQDVASDLQSLTFHYRNGGDPAVRGGFAKASVKLRYRYLKCFDEIHIAYSLDRKSLQHGDEYFLNENDKKRAIRTNAVGIATDSIPIDFNVLTNRVSIVKRVQDNIAGEALGMGCFTGQTRELGKVAALVGPNATADQIKAWMRQLTIGSVVSTLPFALTNTEGPVVPDGSLDPAKPANPSRLSPADADSADDKKVDAANAEALKVARDQSAKIDAQIAANKKAQQDYQDALVRNRQHNDAIAAENARKQREFQARQATYPACVAGDKAACARYQAGQ